MGFNEVGNNSSLGIYPELLEAYKSSSMYSTHLDIVDYPCHGPVMDR